MANRNVEADVIGLIADHLDLARDKVGLEDRLVQDLGIDGRSAAELFAAIEDRFSTDLALLYKRWNRHFKAPGLSTRAGLVMGLAAVVGGAIAGALNLGLVAGLAIVVVLVGGCFFVIVPRRAGPIAPITVGDVVEAVKAESWALRRRD